MKDITLKSPKEQETASDYVMLHNLSYVTSEGFSEGIDRDTITRLLAEIEDNYTEDTKHFLGFLNATRQDLAYDSLRSYAAFLKRERDGKRYSARTINKRLAAAKNRIRYLMDRVDLKESQKYQLERALAEIKGEKIASNAIGSDKVLTSEEIKVLLQSTKDRTIALLIEFLWDTGCRISEALGILLGNIETGKRVCKIRVNGKGSKERIVKISTDLLERIRSYFRSDTYLFEHAGKKYSRVSMSSRIKTEVLKHLGRQNISAHSFRHSFATRKIAETGKVKGVSQYLGHSSVSTTLDLYTHEELTDDDLFPEEN